jgi:hypothetical protein
MDKKAVFLVIPAKLAIFEAQKYYLSVQANTFNYLTPPLLN